MKPLYLWLVMLLCLLTACGDGQAPVADAQTSKTPAESVEVLVERYKDVEFSVLDISEREWQGKNSVAVTVSVPLDSRQNLQRFLLISHNGEPVPGAWVLSEDGRRLYFKDTLPKKTYEILVRTGLPAIGGRTLSGQIEKKLVTRDLKRAVSFASQGNFLPAGLSSGLPVDVVNVNEVDINFHRIADHHVDAFLSNIRHSWNNRFNAFYKLEQWGDLVYSGRFALNPQPNTLERKSIAVEDMDALKEPGLYLAVMQAAGSYDSPDAHWFLVTDIGLQARMYGQGMTVLAQSLATGKALEGVSISVVDANGKTLHEMTTGPQGDVYFANLLQDGRNIVARQGRQLALLELKSPALDLSEFDLGKRPLLPQEAFVYTPRDLFRPGEVVDFSVLLRDADGQSVAPATLDISILQPDGQQVQQMLLSPQDMGYYHYRFAIPASAATGNWNFVIKNLVQGQVDYRFKVEEFLPERMALTFNHGQQEPLRFDARQTLSIPVNGMYLYGAPAAGNRLAASVQVGLLRDALPQYKGFVFGDVRETGVGDNFELDDLFMDDEGNARVEIKPQWKGVRSPLQVQLLASLFENGGRPVVRTYQAQIWPNILQLGIKSSFGNKNPAAESIVEFNLIQVDRSGQLQPLDDAQVNLIREDRNYFWVYDNSNGWHYEFTENEFIENSQNLALKADTGNKVAFKVDWGRYRLEVKDPKTGAVTSLRFFAGEDWYARWEESRHAGRSIRPDAVTLALDKGAYKAGDTARLRINSPHAGEALILVEGDRLLWFKRIHMDSMQAEVDIPVAADWNRHDLYVSAVVLRAASRADSITPNRALGLVHLPLDRTERKLQISINAAEKTLPETTLPTVLQVTDSTGQPFANGFVTLAAVDVGVLNMTDFATPDPFEGFFGRRSYRTDIRDMYGRIIEVNQYDKARIRFGGDSDTALTKGGKAPDPAVQIVSLFNKPVRLDAQGKAKVDLSLPDFNGKIRLMALAFGESGFGSADQETTVAAPLVVQIGMPRFLAPADKARVAIDLHNLSGEAQELAVEISTSGGLKATSEKQTVQLAQDGKISLPLQIQSTSLAQGVIHLNISGKGMEPLQKSWPINMRAAYPAQIQEFSALIQPGASATVPKTLLADVMVADSELRLGIGNSANLNLPGHIHDLLRYPYGCLEQTSSSLFPYALASEQNQTRFQMSPVTAQQRTERIEAGFTRIASMQLGNGGFGMWDNQSYEEHWLTAYVADYMLNVSEQGFAVPPALLERTQRRLLDYVNRSGSLFEQRYSADMEHYRFAYKAYAAYVLARTQKAPLASLRTLHDNHRKDAQSPLPLLHLAIALREAGDQTRSEDALKEAMIKIRNTKKYLGDYGSPVRDQAMMIYLLLKHNIHPDYAVKMSFDLANELKRKRWFSTQEQNALFLAGVMLESSNTAPWQATLKQGGKSQSLAQLATAWRRLEGAALQQNVQVENTGSNAIYLNAQLSAYPLKAPQPQQDQYKIRRQYFDSQGKPVSLKEVRAGDVVIVHLELESDEVAPDSLVVDFIPAGFELENQNLEHAININEFSIDGLSLENLQEHTRIRHQEYRDDRYVAALDLSYGQSHLFYLMRAITPGEYQVAPPYVEDMYRASRRGIGNSEPVTRVLPR